MLLLANLTFETPRTKANSQYLVNATRELAAKQLYAGEYGEAIRALETTYKDGEMVKVYNDIAKGAIDHYLRVEKTRKQGIELADSVVGMVLTSFRPRKSSKWNHIRRYFIMLGFRVFFLMAVREIFHTIGDIIDRHIRLSKYHSIEGVCRRYDIPVFKSRNVNNKNTIDWIQQLSPDILLSSGNQIFRKKLLSVSKIACHNRHTSLLPAYKGIYPIFWCLLHDEEFVGVSVHTMTVQIDQGIVVAQKRLRVQEKDTFFSFHR